MNEGTLLWNRVILTPRAEDTSRFLEIMYFNLIVDSERLHLLNKDAGVAGLRFALILK